MANKNFIIKNGITLEGYGQVVDSAGNWTGVAIGGSVDSAQVLSIVTADGFTKYDSASTLGLIDSDYINARASSGPINDIFYENSTNVTADYTITSGKNAMTAGTIIIDSGYTVTIPTGSRWVVV